MIFSLALILICSLLVSRIFIFLNIPKILAYMLVGILLGPFVFNLLDIKLLSISIELRQIALAIILIRAGLGLNFKDLVKVGRPALLLSFVPACFEIMAYLFLGKYFFNLSFIESGILGCVLSAVSPAIVVPKMLSLINNKFGTDKFIPHMILAGSSCDDIFVIVLLSVFINFQKGMGFNLVSLFSIPILIIVSCLFGWCTNYIFSFFIKLLGSTNLVVNVLLLLGLSFVLMGIESYITLFVPYSGVLAVFFMASVSKKFVSDVIISSIASAFVDIWFIFEILLFVLVGAAINLNYVSQVGLVGGVVVLLALLIRCVGVLFCLWGTNLNKKEKIFCVLAYLPKATVQAAIGSLPLAMNLACGEIVLSMAVIGILISAPLGAFCIDITYKKLLNNCV